jgi:formylglycine-generating enzyme required for sulfatase activity
VNDQGQTFAIIDGPVEFRMGSLPNEPDRFSNETPHRRVIPHRFAIAAQEVTVEQYQRFVRENPQISPNQSYLKKYSPEPNGPMIAVSWYGAAAYCNWLSEQERFPRDQWCYEPNPVSGYAEGMQIKADVLKLKGYRLPTEGEWEYACRAGTVTRCYYGNTVSLLGRHAWYTATSQDRAWPCGSLLPNDLGLFDMLGNVDEWCQDSANATRASKRWSYNDYMNSCEHINDKTLRPLRGETFSSRPAQVRSARRTLNRPSYWYADYGFRPARTYP